MYCVCLKLCHKKGKKHLTQSQHPACHGRAFAAASMTPTMHVESLPQKTSCSSTGNIEVSKGSPINSWWFSGSVMPKTDATESTSIHECLSKVKVSPVLDSSFQILPVAFPAFWGESPAFKMPTNMEDSFRGALTMVGNWKVWPGPTPVHVYRSTLFKVYCLEL